MDKVKFELFWMVFTEGMARSQPTRKHETRESAIKEAKRLAALHPDNMVYILETVGVARMDPAPVIFTDYEAQGKPNPTGRTLMTAREMTDSAKRACHD